MIQQLWETCSDPPWCMFQRSKWLSAAVWESPCRELCLCVCVSPRHTSMWVSYQGVSLNLELIAPVSHFSLLTPLPHFQHLQTNIVHLETTNTFCQSCVLGHGHHTADDTICFSLCYMLLSWPTECPNRMPGFGCGFRLCGDCKVV